jgi:hypothetical protein
VNRRELITLVGGVAGRGKGTTADSNHRPRARAADLASRSLHSRLQGRSWGGGRFRGGAAHIALRITDGPPAHDSPIAPQ